MIFKFTEIGSKLFKLIQTLKSYLKYSNQLESLKDIDKFCLFIVSFNSLINPISYGLL